LKRKILPILWLAAGVILLGWVIAWAGPARIVDALAASLDHPVLLAAAVLLTFVAQALFLLKWHIMARFAGAGLGLRQTLRVFSTLALVGTFTPGRAGELAVPLLMRGGGRLTGVALVNRILESTWTLAVGILAALLMLESGSNVGQLWGVGLVFVALAGAMLVLSRRRCTEAILGAVRACLRPMSRFRPAGWLLAMEEKYAGELGRLYDASARLLGLRSLALFGLMMLGIWLLVVSSSYCLIRATVPPGDKEITFALVVVAVATSAVAISVSPIPAGLGFSEFTVVFLFLQLGYPGEAFLPYLLLSRLIDHVTVILFYFLGRVAGRKLPAAAAAAPDAVAAGRAAD